LFLAFSDADKNQDGYLSMDEYVRVFREHGVNITKEEVSIYFSSKVGADLVVIIFVTSLHPQDKDRDGLISYQEFCGRKTVTEKAFQVRELE
jgi:Ca2+-binding EF-hand superfamily protein